MPVPHSLAQPPPNASLSSTQPSTCTSSFRCLVGVSAFDYGKTLADNKVDGAFEARIRPGLAVPDLLEIIEEEPNVLQIKVAAPK